MDSQYQLQLKSTETDQIFTFHSADGLNSKKSFRKEETLIADKAIINSEEKILIIQSNYGFLGNVLAKKAEKIVMQDTSARACHFSDKNAEENQLQNYKVQNITIKQIESGFDKIIYAPANYEPIDLVKNRIGTAIEKLSQKGQLIISGKKKSGIKRYNQYLKNQTGETEKIGSRNGIKAYKYVKNGKEEIQKPEIEKEFEAKIGKTEAQFKTIKGLFSAGKLDQGTQILLENLKISENEKICDLACGYGAISTIIGKRQNIELYLTDDNKIATEYAEKNLKQNQVENYTVKTGDCLDPYKKQKFDKIISNPPTHQGKAITNKIFKQSHQSLKQDGELWLVYNQNMKYEKQLEEIFSDTEEVTRKNNFLILKANK